MKNIRDYLDKVPEEHKIKFKELMLAWDGSNNYLDSFYSKNVLDMKLKESEEV